MHLVGQKECAGLRIASSRCNNYCRHLLPLIHTQSKKNDQDDMNWCYSTIRPTRTLLTWHNHYPARKVFPHPPYSSQKFYLFSLSNDIQNTSFPDEKALRTWLDYFFNTELLGFHKRGIKKLLQRWHIVILLHYVEVLMINFSFILCVCMLCTTNLILILKVEKKENT